MSLKRSIDQSEMNNLKKFKLSNFSNELLTTCINNIRILSAEMVQAANSGHPGAPMGCAPMAHLLYGHFMNYSSENPKFYNRDRFVLSNGHACALLYSMLHLTDHGLTIDDLKQFRQYGSITPGHPENFATPGVECSTGPLGQGISTAVGMAIAEKHLAAVFNKNDEDIAPIVDHYTYVICGDGCLQEGISSEASSLAGHLKLGKLIVLYDDNKITIDGSTDLSFTEDVGKRYESYNWHVQSVSDVNDLESLYAAIENAKNVTDKPSLIKVNTVIGHGSLKEGTHGVHGAPLGNDDIQQLKKKWNFNENESFVVKPEVKNFYQEKVKLNKEAIELWQQNFNKYSAKYPELAADFVRRMEGDLPANWANCLPTYDAATEKKAAATRNRSEEVLNAVGTALDEIVGGSADLTPSNLTYLKASSDFQSNTPQGRYIRFGVREHAMAAISNGLQLHGGIRPYCATFLNFIGYALGAVRLSALSRLGVIYIMTHDSIGLGEDGPTHQPIEMLASLRTMPNLYVIRPCDGNEVSGAYKIAVESKHTPSVLSLSRQAASTLPGSNAASVALGAYTIYQTEENQSIDLVLVATGTEVELAIKGAKEAIAKGTAKNIRVVSMPCTQLFDKQTQQYKEEIFPIDVPVVSVEASEVSYWKKYAHASVGIPEGHFGLSAPANKIYDHFGLNVAGVSDRIADVLAYFKESGEKPWKLFRGPSFPKPKVLH